MLPTMKFNEDWLEKKMLCFMRRHKIWTTLFSTDKQSKHALENCNDNDCSFCFPEDKSKIDEQFIEDHIGKTEKDKPEKVTVEELRNIINHMHDLRGRAYYGSLAYNEYLNQKYELIAVLEKKLTYLVSLQEKSDD